MSQDVVNAVLAKYIESDNTLFSQIALDIADQPEAFNHIQNIIIHGSANQRDHWLADRSACVRFTLRYKTSIDFHVETMTKRNDFTPAGDACDLLHGVYDDITRIFYFEIYEAVGLPLDE